MEDRFAKLVFRVSSAILVFLSIFSWGMIVATEGYPPVPQLRELGWTMHELFWSSDEDFSQLPATHEEQVRTLLPDELEPGLVLVSGDIAPRTTVIKVIDREGNVVHEWRPEWHQIWGDDEGDFPRRPVKGMYVHGLEILPDGSIVADFAHESTFRMDLCGNVLWKLDNLGHHTVSLAPDGTLWVPAEDFIDEGDVGLANHTAPFRSWLLQQISPDGRILQSIPIADVLRDNGLEGLLYMTQTNDYEPQQTGDTLHLNAIKVFPEGLESDLFKPGDLMVSLRNVNTVLVLDGTTLKVKFVSTGHVIRQHDPVFMAGDIISVFDNRPLRPMQAGEASHSRIVEIDAKTGAMRVVLDGDNPVEPFYTQIMGAQQRLENGNILVVPSGEGRLLEFTADGRLAWWYENRTGDMVNGRTFNADVLPVSMDRAFFERGEAACAK